jgi:hypothetical protein
MSRDPRVFILPEAILGLIGRLMMACLLGLLIFTPVVIVECMQHTVSRFLATLIGTIVFVAGASLVTKARSVEVFAAGATYVIIQYILS